MADKGWIKTYRQILDCWLWTDKEPYDKRSAWMYLLLTANHSDKKIMFNGELIVVKRGQILTSIRTLAEKWKWSYDKTLRFLRLIESDGMIEKESDKFRTLITIVNYEVFQDSPNTERTEISEQTSERISDKQELKNEKNINIRSNSCDLNDSDKPKKKNTKLTEEENEELVKNFEIIYNSYPKKVGKTAGFELYKQWLNGRDILGKRIKLTNRQMWLAIARYKKQIEDNETEKQFIKQFDTFMRKPILDYIGDIEQ